ncbi:MAG TPA: TolC family protein [Candidatus Hydrogenedentes bacterium]|nr:TolC family protein [Candidatus Hydrogenedentota bacterium]HIJ73096.1 TolC family protein [Candidatus Hydrogenedentota bacterium]
MVRKLCTVFTVLLLGCCCAFPADGDEQRSEDGPAPQETHPSCHAPSESRNSLVDEPAGVLTLARAVELVLLRSPYLEPFSQEVRAAEARALQARLRPNPELTLEVDEVRWRPGPEPVRSTLRLSNTIEVARRVERRERSGFSDAEITIRLSQLIELGGKRAKRARLADHESRVAGYDYEVAKADALAQMAMDFVEALVLQEHRQLAQNGIRRAEETLAKLSQHLGNGELTVKELDEARVQLGEAKIEREHIEHSLNAARLRLAAAWGGTQPTFDSVAGRLADISPIPSEAELLERMEDNPEIARWAAEVEARRAAIALEKANALPDMDARVTFKTDRLRPGRFREIGLRPGRLQIEQSETVFDRTRDDTLMLEFSIPLPLFDRNQGVIEEARCLAAKAAAESRAAQFRVRTELVGLRAVLAATHAEIEILDNEVIVAAADMVEAVRRGMQLGTYTHFDLMDATQDLHDYRRDRLDALLTYHQTLAELERLLGAPLLPNQRHTPTVSCE